MVFTTKIKFNEGVVICLYNSNATNYMLGTSFLEVGITLCRVHNWARLSVPSSYSNLQSIIQDHENQRAVRNLLAQFQLDFSILCILGM